MGNEMLLAYVFDAVFICLTAFSFTVIDDLYKFIRYFSFFLSLLIELFNLCIMGQLLVDHSQALSVKIFCSNWIYADAKTKKILLMLLLRTQRPFKLTANKFVIMNLNTYGQICSSSYQLFNLLHTMYKP
ncbi:hypothetical protein O0L34_g11492 [Tuta absoluta]|nr:hypothetical protein O0L34_g11492 [Tuta absoluta]